MIQEAKDKPLVASLDTITNKPPQAPPRTLLYGRDGVGKSTFCAEIPDAIFICTEDGAGRIDVPKFPLCKTWDDVFAQLRALAMEKHNYKCVVLDSADWAQALAVAHVIKHDFGGSIEKYDAFKRGYNNLSQEWTKLLSALESLHELRGMEIALIAHALKVEVKDPLREPYSAWVPNLLKAKTISLRDQTRQWCDIVLYAEHDIAVVEGDRSDDNKGVMKKERICHSASAAGHEGKVRAGWSLPDKFPLNQSIFREHITKDIETND